MFDLSDISSEQWSRILLAATVAALFLGPLLRLGRVLAFIPKTIWKQTKKLYHGINNYLLAYEKKRRNKYLEPFQKKHFKQLRKPQMYTSRETFEPWRETIAEAYAYLTLGIVSLAAVCIFFTKLQNVYVLAFSIAPVVFLYAALSHFEHAYTRKRGALIEKTAIESLREILPQDWRILPGFYIANAGDVDVPLELGNGERCVVEIKSWNGWASYARTKKAVDQVHRLRRKLNAQYSILWLPNYRKKPIAKFHSNVHFVGGDAAFLLEKIRKVMRHETIIRFPAVPSEGARDRLKEMGFMYVPELHYWSKHCTQRTVDKLKSIVAEEGGKITVDDLEEQLAA